MIDYLFKLIAALRGFLSLGVNRCTVVCRTVDQNTKHMYCISILPSAT